MPSHGNRDYAITHNCEECGQVFHPWLRRPGRTCSRQCANSLIARESAAARGNAQRGRGADVSYRKLNGKHEHRRVAEEAIGRPLCIGEVVHHLDGNHLNNDPANLVVLPSQSIHVTIEQTGKVCPVGCLCGKHRKRVFTPEHRQKISASLRDYWILK